MPTTCLICCEQAQYFLLPPCNHKEMCWKCSVTMLQGSTFSCPYCKDTPQGTSCILFVNEEEMKKYTFQEILKKSPYKSAQKSYQFYSNENVAHFIQSSTSTFCRLCNDEFININALKKHLNEVHRKQYCDVCLENRKCLFSEQYLYSEGELTAHLKKGEYSNDGELVLYHPWCDFCKARFYDIDAFKAHIRISSHSKCHICDQNYPKLKHVYYKDYPEMEKHFAKSHYICQIGSCFGKQIENVYVSEQMLEEHKNRVHNQNKHGNKANKPVMNLILFDANKQEDFEWDRIGKDFSKEFMIAEKSFALKNQEHHDNIIDIREFYPQLIKDTHRMSLQNVRCQLAQYLFHGDLKARQIHFNNVPLFCPLEMSSLTRFQLEKFIRDIYEPKYSEPMIDTFFTKKFDFRSTNDYLSDVRGKMKSFSSTSYYYVFPQLIRFLKDTNPMKQTMDEFYAESLRELKLNHIYIFHKKQRYSDILHIFQSQIESYIYELMIEEKINLNTYLTYLKDLNPAYYQTNHAHIFYVQKEKMKNMYHMVEKTKTKELLKLNWLLKLGLSNASYKIIYDKFYYKTVEDCGEAIKNISLQELALLYAYTDICLQALIDKNLFSTHKSNPPTLFLSIILNKVKTCIGSKQLTMMRQIENKSIEIAAKLNSYNVHHKKKGVVVDEKEHPSLLSEANINSKSPENLVIFGVQWQSSGRSNIKKIKNINSNKKKQQQEEEEFPELIKNNKKKVEIFSKQDEDEFPVFNFKEPKARNQEVNQNKEKKKKNFEDKQSSTTNIEKFDLLNAFPSQKTTQEYYKNLEKSQEGKKNVVTKEQVKKSQKWTKLIKGTAERKQNESTQCQSKIEVVISVKEKRKKQHGCAEVGEVTPPPTSPTRTQEVGNQMYVKKTKEQLRTQEEYSNKRNKNDKKRKKQSNQQQQGMEKKPAEKQGKKKKNKVRLDVTDSEQEQERRKAELEKQREEKLKRFQKEQKIKETLRYHDGFDSLLSNENSNSKGNSIINTLIEESKKAEVKQTEIKVRKGKKGKAIVTERVDLSKL